MVYGPGPERVLMALCALVPGTPLIYHYQESGLGPFLQRLYAVRKQVPELTAGEADFLAARCSSPDVMTFLRGNAPDVSLVALNLGGEVRRCQVSLPASARGMVCAQTDLLGGAAAEVGTDGDLVFTLQPFGAAVFTADAGAPAVTTQDQPQVTVSPARVDETDTGVVLQNAFIRAELDPARGGLLSRLETTGGRELLSVRGFDEGQRRLWLGTERVALEGRRATTIEHHGAGAAQVVTASGTLTRRRLGASEPLADYSVDYRLGEAAELDVTYRFTARQPVRGVLGSLTEVLRLDPAATEWFVSTAEGSLRDWAEPRWPRDARYGGVYLRGVGDRVWQSQDQPLGIGCPWVAARGDGDTWTVLEYDLQPAQRPRNLLLKTRLGDTAGLHVVSQWLDGEDAVALESGESLTFRYRVRLWTGTAQELCAQCERGNTLTRGPVALKVRGSRYELSNGQVECAFSRFGAGRLSDLRLAGDPGPLLSGSNVYSDVGIYGDYTTPEMRKVRSYMSSGADPEATAIVVPGDGELAVSFQGVFRGQDGRGVASPVTSVRSTYRLGGGPSLEASLGVRTAARIPEVRAFLAQTLSLPSFEAYRANARDGVVERSVAGLTDRVWQSKASGFGADPWLECQASDGRALRIEGGDLANALQNTFALRTGGGEGVVFLALNDLEPADIGPAWRTVSYRLTPLRGVR
jgi:hypothetical protein